MIYIRNHHPGIRSLEWGVGYFGKPQRLHDVSDLPAGSRIRILETYSGLVRYEHVWSGKTGMFSAYELERLFDVAG